MGEEVGTYGCPVGLCVEIYGRVRIYTERIYICVESAADGHAVATDTSSRRTNSSSVWARLNVRSDAIADTVKQSERCIYILKQVLYPAERHARKQRVESTVLQSDHNSRQSSRRIQRTVTDSKRTISIVQTL